MVAPSWPSPRALTSYGICFTVTSVGIASVPLAEAVAQKLDRHIGMHDDDKPSSRADVASGYNSSAGSLFGALLSTGKKATAQTPSRGLDPGAPGTIAFASTAASNRPAGDTRTTVSTTPNSQIVHRSWDQGFFSSGLPSLRASKIAAVPGNLAWRAAAALALQRRGRAHVGNRSHTPPRILPILGNVTDLQLGIGEELTMAQMALLDDESELTRIHPWRWDRLSMALGGANYAGSMLPIVLVVVVLTMACLVSNHRSGSTRAPLGTVRRRPVAEDGSLSGLRPSISPEELTGPLCRLHACWAAVCRMVPALLVFGTPAAFTALACSIPEGIWSGMPSMVAALLGFQGVYLALFAGISMRQMQRTMGTDFWKLLKLRRPFPTEKQVDKQLESPRVEHWVIIPQYEMDIEIVSETLRSIALSQVAQASIGVVIAMEEREKGSREKVELLQAYFEDQFMDILVSHHPAGLQNDPPGKASNLAWAFRNLIRHLQSKGTDTSRTVLTICNADSEFHPAYFEGLTSYFIDTEEDKRYSTIWQAPVLHLKNYQRQPTPVAVVCILRCVRDLAALSDPHGLRLPQNTYSLALDLAQQTGGWDAEWPAEDWHMGIKCMLLTMGRATLEPIMLPTVSYMPEYGCLWKASLGCWTQATKQALGFTCLTYYFTMLPFVFAHLASRSKQEGGAARMTQFWRLSVQGIALIVRLFDTHVLLSVFSAFGMLCAVVQFGACVVIEGGRGPAIFFEGVIHGFPPILLVSLAACTIAASTTFVFLHMFMRARILGSKWRWTSLHWIYTTSVLSISIPLHFIIYGFAIWSVAWNVLVWKVPDSEEKPDATSKRTSSYDRCWT